MICNPTEKSERLGTTQRHTRFTVNASYVMALERGSWFGAAGEMSRRSVSGVFLSFLTNDFLVHHLVL